MTDRSAPNGGGGVGEGGRGLVELDDAYIVLMG